MDGKTFRKYIALISYTGLLLVVVLHLKDIMAQCKEVAGVLAPFVAGFAIAFVLTPLCVFFTKWVKKAWPKMKDSTANGVAVGLTYVFLFTLVYALISVVIPKLVESVGIFAESMKGYTENLQKWLIQYSQESDNEALNDLGVDLASLFNYLSAYLEDILQGILATFSVAAGQVMAMTGEVLVTLFNGAVALVFSVYMLADRARLQEQCRRLLFAYTPKKFATGSAGVVALASDTFSKFVAGQLLEACILGGLCTAGMLFIQAEYALLIGIIVGLSSLVPVAGAYVGGGFCFALLFMVSPMDSVAFVVFLVVLQQFEGNVIYPRVVGSSIGLPGLWVVFGVIIGGGLFGLLGVLLSVPTLSVCYALLRQDVERREKLKA